MFVHAISDKIRSLPPVKRLQVKFQVLVLMANQELPVQIMAKRLLFALMKG